MFVDGQDMYLGSQVSGDSGKHVSPVLVERPEPWAAEALEGLHSCCLGVSDTGAESGKQSRSGGGTVGRAALHCWHT